MNSPLEPEGMAQEAARYRTLLEINNAVISNLTQDALFHAIAQALRRVVAFDRTAIFLHDRARDVLRLFVLESSLPTSYFTVGLEMPSGESHVGRVLRTQESLVRRDLATEREYPMEDRAYEDGVRPPGSTSKAPGDDALDGIKVDGRGNLYVSGPGGLWILSPDGKHPGDHPGPGAPAQHGVGRRLRSDALPDGPDRPVPDPSQHFRRSPVRIGPGAPPGRPTVSYVV